MTIDRKEIAKFLRDHEPYLVGAIAKTLHAHCMALLATVPADTRRCTCTVEDQCSYACPCADKFMSGVCSRCFRPPVAPTRAEFDALRERIDRMEGDAGGLWCRIGEIEYHIRDIDGAITAIELRNSTTATVGSGETFTQGTYGGEEKSDADFIAGCRKRLADQDDAHPVNCACPDCEPCSCPDCEPTTVADFPLADLLADPRLGPLVELGKDCIGRRPLRRNEICFPYAAVDALPPELRAAIERIKP